ncbi:hypothetical protein [Nocardia inohanensis]|uniref:hypothetical protein n=1 Tax=Nocardia inohanensis TaxID=209246 RepID=UPI00082A48F8|nr:hypothetical protein [Nocardia inohanensis]
MTSGFDDRKPEPGSEDQTANWWQGAPAPGSQWDSQAQHPIQPPGYGPQPNPYGAGANPPSGANPYPSGANPPISVDPARTGANPFQTGPNPYQTGPVPYQPAQPPYGGNYGPPPGGNNRVWWYAGIGALVVALVAVVAVVLVTRDSGTGALPATSTSAAATTTSKPRTSTPTTTPSSSQSPRIPGYQVVVPAGTKAAWDVPSDWAIDQTANGWGSGSDRITVAGLAQEGVGYCPNYVRSNMFLSTSTLSDPAAAATDIGKRMAKLGWETLTSVDSGAPESFSSSDNALHGSFVETSGAFTPPDPSCAKTYSIYTFAVSGGEGALVLTIAADTGVDRAVDRDFARRLLATFRLL